MQCQFTEKSEYTFSSKKIHARRFQVLCSRDAIFEQIKKDVKMHDTKIFLLFSCKDNQKT